MPADNPFIYVLLGEPDDAPMLLGAQQGISTIFSGRMDSEKYENMTDLEEEVTFNAMGLTTTRALARSDAPCREEEEQELHTESYHRLVSDSLLHCAHDTELADFEFIPYLSGVSGGTTLADTPAWTRTSTTPADATRQSAWTSLTRYKR